MHARRKRAKSTKGVVQLALNSSFMVSAMVAAALCGPVLARAFVTISPAQGGSILPVWNDDDAAMSVTAGGSIAHFNSNRPVMRRQEDSQAALLEHSSDLDVDAHIFVQQDPAPAEGDPAPAEGDPPPAEGEGETTIPPPLQDALGPTTTGQPLRRKPKHKNETCFEFDPADFPGQAEDPSQAVSETDASQPAPKNMTPYEATVCCDPFAVPKPFYMKCMEDNCYLIKKPATPPKCDALKFCNLEVCKLNCCCFFRQAFRFAQLQTKSSQRTMISLVIMIWSMQNGYVDRNTIPIKGLKKRKLPKKKLSKKDAQETANYGLDVILDCVKLFFGIPTFFWFCAVCYDACCARKTNPIKRPEAEKGVRGGGDANDPNADFMNEVGAMTDEEYEKRFLEDEEFRKKMELQEFLTSAEQERLGGGVVEHVVTKLSGLGLIKWLWTNWIGLAFFTCLMTVPETSACCVLGQSGRIMVLSRKPLLTANEACKMFWGIGFAVIMECIIVYCYLRSLEFSVHMSKKSSNPEFRQQAAALPAWVKAIAGKVAQAEIGVIALIWFLHYLWLKTRIRSIGFNDVRNYYESKEASVGQYFRAGVRGAIPCCSKRRRVGGMRIFFGPYPAAPIFNHMGSKWWLLKELEPLVVLPKEGRDPYPPSGGGSPMSKDDEAGLMGKMMAGLNVILGLWGFAVLAIHWYNQLQNLQNCPIGAVVKPCATLRDCSSMAKTQWFEHYLVQKKLRTADQVMMDRMQAKISAEAVGNWLNISDSAELKKKIRTIAHEVCDERYSDLITGPNETIESGFSDSIGRYNAVNYMTQLKKLDYNITWDPKEMTCKGCTKCYTLFYYTNIENVVEIVEVIILWLTAYISAKMAGMGKDALLNCPMIDLPFKNMPGSKQDVDVGAIEKACLKLMGVTFSLRYQYSGVPEHIARLERESEKNVNGGDDDPKHRKDPWEYSDKAQTWDEYELMSKTNSRKMIVNKMLLGIITSADGKSPGEEVVAAWSEQPRFNMTQKIIIYGGFLVFCLFPVLFAFMNWKQQCLIEAIVTSIIHYILVDYFILRRRPQAGIVLTSRRVFQITRRPAYRDIFGRVEPLIKLDILVHNCGMFYMSMNMEAHVPCWKRCLAKCLRTVFHRRGQVIVSGTSGIFKVRRIIGDTREVFYYLSKTQFMKKLESLRPADGEQMKDAEKAEKGEELPDPPCACCCCPNSPVPPAMIENLLERYAKRIKHEKDVYDRKMAIRPSSCGQLCCGRGCRLGCECCCCCQLDELLTECIVTTHRLVVEQRALQRYCRMCGCLRKTPNLRVTWLAHDKAGAYMSERPAYPFGMRRLKQDWTTKLLMEGAREYSSGLMLMQSPYYIMKNKEFPKPDKLWVTHVASIFDTMTQKAEYGADDEDSMDGDDEEVGSDEEAMYDDDQFGLSWEAEKDEIEAGFAEEEGKGKGKGKKGKGKKGAAPKAKGKAKAKAKAKGKGKGKKGKGKGKAKAPPAWEEPVDDGSFYIQEEDLPNISEAEAEAVVRQTTPPEGGWSARHPNWSDLSWRERYAAMEAYHAEIQQADPLTATTAVAATGVAAAGAMLTDLTGWGW